MTTPGLSWRKSDFYRLVQTESGPAQSPVIGRTLGDSFGLAKDGLDYFTVIHLKTGKSLGSGTWNNVMKYCQHILDLADWSKETVFKKDSELYSAVSYAARIYKIEHLG